jgi:hypothetical protein
MLAMGEHGRDGRFMWFGPPELNTYVNRRIRVVLLCVVQTLAWFLVALSSA